MNDLLEDLIEAAVKGNWAFVDENIAKALDKGSIKRWAHEQGIHDGNLDVRDLSMSMLEIAFIDESTFDNIRDTIYQKMIADSNPYVRYRAAFTLVTHGVGDYETEVVDALHQAEKDPVTAEAARRYLPMIQQLKDLGLDGSYFGYQHAVRALRKEPDSFETMKRLKETTCLTHNTGGLYLALSKSGREKVDKVLDRYSETDFYTYHLSDLVKAAERADFETIDRCIEAFGTPSLREFAPFYKELGEALESEEEIGQYEITFYGKVQGVNFRREAALYAERINLVGWVINEPDGSVKCQIQAKDSMVNVFILALTSSSGYADNISSVGKKEVAVGEPMNKF